MKVVQENNAQGTTEKSSWQNDNLKKLLIALSAIFLITAWYRFILALILLPLIFFVYKRSKLSIILAVIYTVLLTLVNISVYVSNNYDSDGTFSSSPWPIFIFFLILIGVITFSVKSYKEISKSTT